jgi:hypothetical protein
MDEDPSKLKTSAAVPESGSEQLGPLPTPSGIGALERVRANLQGTVGFAPGFDVSEGLGEKWNAQED